MIKKGVLFVFKIYNKQALTRNERYQNALIAGIGITIVLTILYGLLCGVLSIRMQILYIGIGYLIGMVIQKAGHGVQLRFSITAAVLALICFFISDIIAYFGFSAFTDLSYLSFAVQLTLQMWFATDMNSLIILLMRVVGIAAAYQFARVV